MSHEESLWDGVGKKDRKNERKNILETLELTCSILVLLF